MVLLCRGRRRCRLAPRDKTVAGACRPRRSRACGCVCRDLREHGRPKGSRRTTAQPPFGGKPAPDRVPRSASQVNFLAGNPHTASLRTTPAPAPHRLSITRGLLSRAKALPFAVRPASGSTRKTTRLRSPHSGRRSPILRVVAGGVSPYCRQLSFVAIPQSLRYAQPVTRAPAEIGVGTA